MAKYPGSQDEARIAADALQALVTNVLLACRMSAQHANLLARTLVSADLRGIHSHGVLRVPEYVKKLTLGGVNAQGEPRVVSENGVCLVVDCANNMGQIGAAYAMEQCIAKARSLGAAFCAVRGSNHCGAMDYYAMMALPHDMIGIATTNALPTMAPWGGIERVLGMNPLAVAVPAGQEDPIVLDIAFATSAHGKIRVYQQKGYAIPTGWAYDKAGNPTTDAQAALEGLIAPIGAPAVGYKGTGLAIVMGILSSFLSGAAFGTELGSIESGPAPGMDCHFVGALRVDAFIPSTQFKARVDQLARQLRSSEPAPGFEHTYAPGQMEAECARTYQREGIPLNRATLQDLHAAAMRLGVDTGAIASALARPGG